MTSPAVAATNTSATAAASTSHTVNLPTGIARDDLLVVFFGTVTSANAVGQAVTDWTRIQPGGRIIFYTRVADGSEGSTLAVTTDISTKAAHASYRVTGQHASTAPVKANSVTTTDAAPDPPNLAPVGGSADYLWIVFGCNDGTATVSTWPTGYTADQLNPASGGSGASGTKCVTFVANKPATASSDNPAAMVITASQLWTVTTMAVYPAVEGGLPGTAKPIPFIPQGRNM